MNWIAKQPYYKVQREVSSTEQKTVVHDRWLYLYEDKIVTGYRRFPIDEVFDMSYRRLGSEEGVLYLHTKQGVYSYTVKADPGTFIEAFKELETTSREHKKQ
ncbi:MULTISPECIES: hypothetical protein [unclassified Paenibacillus]|uniref:hypothetical protein n=1 Tax=unclassified Paenibacillus TaxID=185978 RepID=UPI001AE5EF2E|nr:MULTISPECIES: hypothetical protein [unclassified Paenibacillus]MBP1155747.1 hypothetical protein [Paenibacillus sp. PvP091]MBP1168867.1 hypothetical protein [Paenibacillus sp. PvR098]MBP2439895.1 hypothetical protein [Paenibacillus sp. PvP052]